MEIQVWSDVVCPWCYIGKRRLENALAEFGGDVTVTWRAFQLDPTTPDRTEQPSPVPLVEALATKFGGEDRAKQMFAQVTEIAATEGLTLDFDRALAANTLDSHRLMVWANAVRANAVRAMAVKADAVQDTAVSATPHDRSADLMEALHQAHFSLGVDLGSRPALAAVAASVGLDAGGALAYLESEAGREAVDEDLAAARELGITSVPTFVIDGKYAIQGAQDKDTLVSAFREITRRSTVDADR